MIASSPTASYNDFYFAGETQSLNNGTIVKSFENTVGFIMKSKIKLHDESCFNLPTGYSVDMRVDASFPFEIASFLSYDGNNWGSGSHWFTNLQSASSITLESSFFNKIS
jgi:hypothetical protein